MPSNDDIQPQNKKTAKGRAYGDAAVASGLLDDHAKGAGHISMNEDSMK